jgi:CheY-like chemotaxis protein
MRPLQLAASGLASLNDPISRMRFLDLTRKARGTIPRYNSDGLKRTRAYDWRNGSAGIRSAILEKHVQEAGLPAKILISVIDDDDDAREALAALMKSRGFTVEAFPSALEFLACPYLRETSCLIVDVHMPRMTGIELHRRLVESGYAIPTILITAYPDESARARALADGIICYLSKPCDEDALVGCVWSALERAKPGEYHP